MKQFYSNWLRLVLMLAMLIPTMLVRAQDVTISGKVTSKADHLPLPGVTVSVKGSNIKTSTATNGSFKIPVTAKDKTLIFSYTGYKSKEIAIGMGNINVEMEEDASNLSDVVVVGYGTQKKSDVTGAVATVDKKRLEDLPNTNFAQALQGSIPGISIDQNSGGAEGNGTTIRIRGRNSISAGTSPLYILDGVPFEGSISELNPGDFESINVLKDASAAAIYGSRGANGVILLTSKKGSKGKTTISYDGFFGTQNISNLPRMLTPEEFYQFKMTREPSAMTASEKAVYASGIFPDWVDLVTRTGTKQQHNIAVSGGSEKSRYYFSTTYLDNKGVAVNDEFKRLTTRINLESNLKSWLTFGSNSQLSYIDRSGLPGTFADQTGAFRLNPLTTAFNANGTPTIYPWPEDLFFPNPLAPTLAENEDNSYKVITNNYLNVDIPFIKGLSYRINTGVEFTIRDQKTYYGLDTRTGFQTKGDLTKSNSKNSNILVENIINYNRTFGKHSIAFTGLYSYQGNIGQTSGLEATGFPNDVLTYYQENIATSIIPNTPGYVKAVNISQMGRLNYAYNNKYLLTFTVRRDGYSGFGENNKYATFPSIALGWNITNEEFLKDNKVINSLKLRASYGSNGNQAVDPYQTLARLSTRSYVDGATTLPGYVPATLATPDLRWETTVGANIGVDFSLFKGRIEGSIDAYSKETHDLLLKRSIASTHGATSIWQNIGKTSNKGFEIGLNTVNVQAGEFKWSSNISFSLNRNKIKDLYGDKKSDTSNTWFIGQPIDVNYGYVFGGIWQTGEDFSKSPQPNTLAGYAKVIDLNGDGKITENGDKTIIGSLQPSFIWGFGNTFTYKGFQLYAFWQGVQGTSARNTVYSDNVQNGVRNNTYLKDWWTPTNPSNTYWANQLGANLYNVGIIESNSYARLKDLSLAYNFSAQVLNKLKISRLKVYANARNLATITKWKGMDPELNTQDDIPLQKEFIFGINIGL